MDKKYDAGQALKTLLMELVIPEELTVDGPKEQKIPGTEFIKCCQRNDILLTRTETERPS